MTPEIDIQEFTAILRARYGLDLLDVAALYEAAAAALRRAAEAKAVQRPKRGGQCR